MSYRILVSGSAQLLVKEFSMLNDPAFECRSVPDDLGEIIGQMDEYVPDAYLGIYDKADGDVINCILTIKVNYSETPFFITGDKNFWDAFDKEVKDVAVHRITRPITAAQIAERIKTHIPPDKLPSPAPAAYKPAARPAAPSFKPSVVSRSAPSLPPLDLDMSFSLEDLKKSFEEAPPKKRIVVVDDDRNMLKLVKSALEKEYEITTIASGKMAIKFFETKMADLVLLDYEMPEITGPDVLKKIREDPRTARIPVIFLTGVADSEKIKEVLEYRPRDYILKPINLDRLNASIKKAIK